MIIQSLALHYCIQTLSLNLLLSNLLLVCATYVMLKARYSATLSNFLSKTNLINDNWIVRTAYQIVPIDGVLSMSYNTPREIND